MIMEKNQWRKEFYDNLRSSQLDISWTSSDSERESQEFTIDQKRKKINAGSIVSWIKPVLTDSHTSKTPEDSPIISSLPINDMSPVLTGDSTSETKYTSPVIGKRKLLHQMRTKFKKKNTVIRDISKELSCSPDMFESQNSQRIEHSSPELQIQLNTSEDCIYTFPSQHSSQIKSTTSSVCNSSDDIYCSKSSKRKRTKKKGLASKLQRSLSLEKSRTSIWKHEHSMNRNSAEEGVIQVKVLNIKNEYGNIILECHDESITMISDTKTPLKYSEDTNLVLVLVHKTEVNMLENKTYTIFPPYESRIIKYKNKEIVCYFNVTRILK